MKHNNPTPFYSCSGLASFIRNTFMILFVLSSGLNHSQQEQESLPGSWLVVSGTHKISDRLSIPTVGILRHYTLFNQYEFAFFRTGLTYRVNKKTLATAGIAYLNAESHLRDIPARTTEQFWIYEEVVFLAQMEKIALSNRIRLETRWIDTVEGTLLNNRIRYRLQGTYAINHRIYAKTFNEFFLNLKPPYFNQNRLFVGFGYRFAKNVQGEIGYLKNQFKTASYDRVRLALIFKVNFTNPKSDRPKSAHK
ncbi:DUF2490 domain-containing protein [Maribacter sp. 2304DJ31-5]|uniref:DUF2490 domain-containing protein n=1 Tax=Maribacter sp. 2304DJ31-5 TaxID=3386273 RepID=UPI0039BD386E